MSSSPKPSAPVINFPNSPIPKNPLGEGRYIKTAAALIIGDEILNGNILDRNSNYFARFCFENGIELQGIEVIADDELKILEASRRMVQKYDFVITSGGIGPSHDDITYPSLAKSFGQELKYHDETLRRMEEASRHRTGISQQLTAAGKRMALFPEAGEVLFVASDTWVPVVRLEGKLCIFPGIPSLFQKLLDNLKPFLPLPADDERPFRLQVFTPLSESSIAPFLTDLQKRVKPENIRIGSYPLSQPGAHVALTGSDRERVKELGLEVEKELQGRLLSAEETELMIKDKRQ
ncbi:MoaB/Mog domain-containing protein [Suillus clintonianus]|uniref:MoaB/Mog domain-containing protein n=1 Tax=Suillus clintonianus TaxID=1904413 RepID=UPI001B8810A6|nr:MoaB/Mog domain-containing protein [Suillus clintonianus]KAG2124797.1 MoaB/Mog domain-containing protein [Suillus clintonianus]